MASTRRLLERVPSDKGPWKPHEKSMALGHLVQLVASMPGWITSTLLEPHVDLAATDGYGFHPTDALLKTFDPNVKQAPRCPRVDHERERVECAVVAQERRTRVADACLAERRCGST